MTQENNKPMNQLVPMVVEQTPRVRGLMIFIQDY